LVSVAERADGGWGASLALFVLVGVVTVSLIGRMPGQKTTTALPL
jgi:hypothetical protein